ncbi:YeeE/YedE family protein [Shimia ponticola]|uniref:YeeE/YedE family protein n=1 Tax=Shimia ponticola TaxID=2582893 RepID=UPI0011BE2ABD|nr:YeeE/YedE family protein [Shimia ponticola]
MLDTIGDANAIALVGLVGGLILGLAARLGRFCTLGSIEDFLYSSDDRRLRMWGVAIGVSMIGTFAATALGIIDITASGFLDVQWVILASVVGGLLFGYGMAICGNCGYGALARLGGGDLRSFVIVLVMGLSGYVAMSGPLAHLRIWLFPVEQGAAQPQGYAYLAGDALNLSPSLLGMLAGTVILIVSLASTRFLRSPSQIAWGAAVGVAIVTGWVGSWWVANTGFDGERFTTHSFVAPVGDTLYYLMTASGNTLSFSVGSVFGVLGGAWIGSLIKGHFRWEACEDPRELRRQVGGAAIMGVGAIIAGGCSVGQGISAFSTLSFSAPIVFLSIFAGAALGLRQLIVGFAPAE